MKIAILLLIFGVLTIGQSVGPATLILFSGAPTGGCSQFQIAVDTTTGILYSCPNGSWWMINQAKLPTGMIAAITTGSCPTGTTEQDSLAGVMFYGTTTANGDIGTTGGASSITPTGTVSAPTFTGASDTVSVGALSWPAGVPTIAAGTFTQPTIAWPGGVPTFTGSAGTVPAETFTGSALTGRDSEWALLLK